MTTQPWNLLLRDQITGHWTNQPMAALVLHINRELIHHLAQVCLLRDLYRHTPNENRQEPS